MAVCSYLLARSLGKTKNIQLNILDPPVMLLINLCHHGNQESTLMAYQTSTLKITTNTIDVRVIVTMTQTVVIISSV